MVVNKVTGERYQEEILGSSSILTSTATGIKRVISLSKDSKKLFSHKKSNGGKVMVRPEDEVVQDLIRSLELEMNYLKLRKQKIFVKF